MKCFALIDFLKRFSNKLEQQVIFEKKTHKKLVLQYRIECFVYKRVGYNKLKLPDFLPP